MKHITGSKWYEGNHNIQQFEAPISQFLLGSEDWESSEKDTDFKGGLTELNIWNSSLRDISTKVCNHVEPFPNILKWSDLDNSTINGTTQDRSIGELCHKSIKTIHQVVPVMLDQERSMQACNILNAELAYPNPSDQFKRFQSKYNMNFEGN